MARIGLIGGTGLYHWGGQVRKSALDTPFGPPSDEVGITGVGRHQLLFLPRHGHAHAIPPHLVNYRANVHAMRELRADVVIAVNAVGGITPNYGPGILVLPDQLIDYTWGRPHSYEVSGQSPIQHAEFGLPFDNTVREALLGAAAASDIPVMDGGCVGVMQGPRLETHAEIERLRRDGCDLVGMTSMPEAALAREAGLPYASLCVVANWAAGIGDRPITMAEIEATLANAMAWVRRLLASYLDHLD